MSVLLIWKVVSSFDSEIGLVLLVFKAFNSKLFKWFHKSVGKDKRRDTILFVNVISGLNQVIISAEMLV